MIHFLEGIPPVLDWLILRIGVKNLKDPRIQAFLIHYFGSRSFFWIISHLWTLCSNAAAIGVHDCTDYCRA